MEEKEEGEPVAIGQGPESDDPEEEEPPAAAEEDEGEPTAENGNEGEGEPGSAGFIEE